MARRPDARGARLRPGARRRLRRLAWALAALTGIDGLTAYLATTPGGIDSVAVMALGSGADAPLVLAVQMLRLFAVILAAARLGRRLSP